MVILGALANAIAVLVGGTIGFFAKKGIPKKYGDAIIQALSIFTFGMGIMFFLKSKEIMVLVISLALGTFLGEWIDIEKRLENFGSFIQSKMKNVAGNFSEGFVTASLIFCVGSMAIMGAMQSGLAGNHEVLFAKSALDVMASLIFASAMGIGVAFASVSVLIYEGGLSLAAAAVAPFLSTAVVDEMTAVGGVLLMALSLSILEIKKIRAGNMLPAMFLPIIIMMFMK